MNKDPETYEELIRKKRCIDLTKYYELSMADLEQIYKFLVDNPTGQVIGSSNLSLVVNGDTSNAVIINSRCTDSSVDGVIMSNKEFRILPHYESSGGSYSGSSFSGGSSNNNNNNNNNNNR